jgi:hypothetical protein
MNKLQINIPSFSTNEMQYAIHCLFKEFLGIDYNLIIDDLSTDTIIKFGDSKFVIKNAFFKPYFIPENYSINHLPEPIESNCEIANSQFEYISLFGNNRISKTSNEIIIESDFIAGAFFMLSRWEELVNKTKDTHDRALNEFSAVSNYIRRPIVNEYVEIIWSSLLALGYKGTRKERSFTIIPTHDIDHPLKWYKANDKLKSIARSIVSLKFSDLLVDLKYMLSGKDVYDVYDKLIYKADEINSKARFYFMSAKKAKFDDGYNIFNKRIQSILNKIMSANHVIGFHPSYNTKTNFQLFINEKQNIEKAINKRIYEGRQHYLRFKMPDTWKMWDANNMKIDSTLGYADCAGFRCGVCYDFPVYDLVERKMLTLLERPLIVMEVTLKSYEKLNAANAVLLVKKLKDVVRKYKGNFVFLWHNSAINTAEWKSYLPVFNEMYILES